MAQRINSVRLVLQGLVVIVLLVWGVYGIIWTQTSPSEQASVVSAILGHQGSLLAAGVTNGGDVIKPGAGAKYIMMFKTAGPACCNQGPSGLSLPTGGFVFGPITWAPLNSNASSYDRRYAVFTDSFSFLAGPSGCCPLWFSGPAGNMTPSMNFGRYGGLEQYAGVDGGFGWGTSIFDVDAPGNYTLHFVNSGAIGNVTARVSMGPSLVTFSRTQPYLYAGATTVGVAVAFSALAALSYRKKTTSTPLKN